jgi:hypothetical protein
MGTELSMKRGSAAHRPTGASLSLPMWLRRQLRSPVLTRSRDSLTAASAKNVRRLDTPCPTRCAIIKIKAIKMITECDESAVGFEAVPACGRRSAQGRRARSAAPHLDEEQAEHQARKGVTESVLFRLFTAFYGFLRLTGKNSTEANQGEAGTSRGPRKGWS